MAKKRPKPAEPKNREAKFRPTFAREWRKFRKRTQEDLGAEIGMTPGNLSNIENGVQGYTQQNLEQLAGALQCTVVELLVRDPNIEEGIWVLWDQASPAEREQILAVAKALMKRAAA